MSEDYLHQARQQNPEWEVDDDICNRALRDIEDLLQQLGNYALSAFGLPQPPRQVEQQVVQQELDRWPLRQQALQRDRKVPMLNREQRLIYDEIMSRVDSREGCVFFVDGVGGSGKTFTYGCILNAVRALGKVALSVASSGIAALLMEGGTTAHSRFKIPVQGLDASSCCFVGRDDRTADLITAAAFIVWDEAGMCHRWCAEAVDRTLRDLMACNDVALRHKPLGGKIVLFGGDFRQVLPVVWKATRGLQQICEDMAAPTDSSVCIQT